MSKSLFSLGVLAATAALALTTAAPAQALSFKLVSGVPFKGDPALGPRTDKFPANVFNFNNLSPDLFTTASRKGTTLTATGDVQVYQGGNSNYAPPYCSGGAPCSNPAGQSTNTSSYLSIGTGGSLLAEFTKPAKYVGFAWGYADDLDSVVVNWFNEFGNLVSQEFTNAVFGNQEDSAYVDIVAGKGETIDSVVWSKYNDGRFEIDNIAVVPTPALLPGLVGMGVVALRKRKQAGEAQEA